MVKTGELHRLATYGSTARCAYAGTLGCWTQPKAIPIVASIANTRFRAYLSLRLISTAHNKIRSILQSNSPLFCRIHANITRPHRTRNYHTRQPQATKGRRPSTRRRHSFADGSALHQANAFVRRGPYLSHPVDEKRNGTLRSFTGVQPSVNLEPGRGIARSVTAPRAGFGRTRGNGISR